MKKYEVTLATKPEFKIHNPEKLHFAVCDSKSDWVKYFNKYDSIEDFLDSFARQAFFEKNRFEKVGDKYTYIKLMEGIGTFVSNDEGWYKLEGKEEIEEFGVIEFRFDNDFDLEVEWSAKEI